MIKSANRLFIIAACLGFFLVAYGLAKLALLDLGNEDAMEARARTLQVEALTLDGRLEKRLHDLDAGIRDAEAHGDDRLKRLRQERQAVIQQALTVNDGPDRYREQISEAEDHLRNDRFEEATRIFSSVRSRLYRMLDDIAAAEYLVTLLPRVEQLRHAWREREGVAVAAVEDETEAGYKLAAEYFEGGRLADALYSYRLLASDYQALLNDAE